MRRCGFVATVRTSDRSTSGGPSAMSVAFVPGRILRSAAWSRLLKSFCCSGEAEMGDSWSSGMGGGLGRRGEAGDVILRQVWASLGNRGCRIDFAVGAIRDVGGVQCVVDFRPSGAGRRCRAVAGIPPQYATALAALRPTIFSMTLPLRTTSLSCLWASEL